MHVVHVVADSTPLQLSQSYLLGTADIPLDYEVGLDIIPAGMAGLRTWTQNSLTLEDLASGFSSSFQITPFPWCLTLQNILNYSWYINDMKTNNRSHTFHFS